MNLPDSTKIVARPLTERAVARQTIPDSWMRPATDAEKHDAIVILSEEPTAAWPDFLDVEALRVLDEGGVAPTEERDI